MPRASLLVTFVFFFPSPHAELVSKKASPPRSRRWKTPAVPRRRNGGCVTPRHLPPRLLAVAYLGFVSLGLPDTVAGVAWPSVRDTFTLPQSGFGLVFLALGCCYCASGFFGGRLTLALGVGSLLTLSSSLVALAMFGSA